MEKRIEYKTLSEREKHVTDNQNLILVAEENLLEGNFLIFSDTPRPIEPIYVDVSKEELESVKKRVQFTEEAITALMDMGMM